MNSKRIGFTVLALLVLAVFATAVPLEVKVVDVATDVESGGVATFKVYVTNNLQDPAVFKITEAPYETAPFSKSIQRIHIAQTQLKVDPRKTGIADVSVLFTDAVAFGKEYSAEVKIASVTHPEIFTIASLHARIVNPNDVIQIIPSIPATAMPGEEFTYDVRFINRLNIPLDEYALVITSDLSALNADERVSLQPREELARKYVKNIPAGVTPGTYTIRIGTYKQGALKGAYTTSIEVMEKPSVEESKEEIKGFFASKMTLIKKNRGNTASRQKIELSASWFKRMFSSFSLEPASEDGKLVWEATLQPGDTFSLEIATDYRMLFYGALVIVVATLLLWLYVDRSVTIKKRVLKVKSDEHGVTELKMLIHVRNGGGNVLEHVRVIDVLPHFVELLPEFSTLKPDKVQQGQQNMRMIWDIASLASREERVITYKVKARLHITGQIALPPASLHYMDGNTLISVRSAPTVYQP